MKIENEYQEKYESLYKLCERFIEEFGTIDLTDEEIDLLVQMTKFMQNK